MSADDIIFHCYDLSPFSEKVRVVFGIKDMAWRACAQPVIMPKPDLIPLTGGYRKIPVMQIGADIFCDSRAIIAELDRRQPSPSIGLGLGHASGVWTDKTLFPLTIPVIFGSGKFQVDEAFIEDRAKLSGQRMDPAMLAAAIPYARAGLRAHLAPVDAQLRAGGKFLAGDTPTYADANLYYILYFVGFGLEPGAALFPELEALEAWRKRVAAIGHGRRGEIAPADALDIAKAAHPRPPAPSVPDDPSGLKPGQRVTVSADDYGRDQIAGELSSVGADHVTILREDPRVGQVAVHFPRAGFVVAPA